MTDKYKILILTPRGKEAADKRVVRLEIGHQSFDVGRDDFSMAEAIWMQRQLTLALDRMLGSHDDFPVKALRYFADGPQGSFFTNNLQLARDLVNLYDKDDDWTITDLENPYGPSNNGS